MGEMADELIDIGFDMMASGEDGDEDGSLPCGFVRYAPVHYGKGPCPRCGAPVRFVRWKKGTFWGCTRYPECNGTRNVEKGEVLPDDKDDTEWLVTNGGR